MCVHINVKYLTEGLLSARTQYYIAVFVTQE